MLDLNRAERRALWLATTLFALGVAARVGLGPDEAAWSWSPTPGARLPAGPAEVADAVRGGIARAEHAARPLAPGERVDPNTAPLVELDRLPGIGPARARAIAEERDRSGPFGSAEDLGRVPGIGPATIRRLTPHLALPGGTSPGAARRGEAAGTLAGGAVGETPPAEPAGRGEAGRPRTDAPLDLNRASAEELERLPGIGPELSRRILDLRARRGRFRSVDDLLAVPGIGPRTLERLRPLVAVR